jgi:hypothetical protein
LLGGYTKIAALEETKIALARAKAKAESARKGASDGSRDSGE